MEWLIKKLGEVADYYNGRAFKPSEWKTSGKPIIRIQNLNDHEANYNYSDQEYEERYRVQDGELLYAWSASLGAHIWKGTDAWLNQHIFKVIPKPDVDKKYLYYFLCQVTEDLYRKTHGSGMVHITKKPFMNTCIPLPNIHEQCRIVSRIEELFSELDNSVRTLQKTKEQVVVYRQAVLKEAFSTEVHAVKKTCEIGEVCLGRQRSPKNVSKYYPTKYIRAANITETGLELDDILEMEFTPVEREKYYLQKGDIVISEASGSATQVGKPAVWNCEIENCCFQNTVIRLRLNKDLPEYVYWYLKFMYSSGAIAKIAGGVGINHLGANKFSNIEIPIPEKEEQKRIVSEIESRLSVCDSIEQTVDTALQQANAMRQSILKQAFEGRL